MPAIWPSDLSIYTRQKRDLNVAAADLEDHSRRSGSIRCALTAVRQHRWRRRTTDRWELRTQISAQDAGFAGIGSIAN